MDRFCWMCILSFKLYEQIWRVLEGLLHRLHLLMMILDCPLAIRHKKGEYIGMEIGGVLEFIDCIQELFDVFHFLAYDVFFLVMMYFFFMGCICQGETLCFVFCFFLCFLFHIWYAWLLIYIMRLFMVYVFQFMFCEIKNLFWFTCIFHTCVYVFVECFRNLQVNSVMATVYIGN